MYLSTACLLVLVVGIRCSYYMDSMEAAMPANPVPQKIILPTMDKMLNVTQIPTKGEYEKLRHHTILTRDHGCLDLPDVIKGSFICTYINLKNKFSDAGIKPSEFFTEYKYDGSDDSWKPVVTWVESIEAKYVRACAATIPGNRNTLGKGKIRWLALYNYTQSQNEQSGVWTLKNLQQVFDKPFTANKHCYMQTFPMAFASKPSLKFQLKLNNAYHSAQDALIIWGKGESSTTNVYICLEEFHAWARYHTDFEIHWYGIATGHVQDDFSIKGHITFAANEATPANHDDMLPYYCKNMTMPNTYHPCQTILLQAFEPSESVCESAIVAWISYTEGTMATVCYSDRRGIVANRPADVEIHYSIYGSRDPCETLNCPLNRTCIHPTYNTAACGCIRSCGSEDEEVCGTNMKTYKNKCTLEKEACESGKNFAYAHKGPCEKYTYDHGRSKLDKVSECDGLYCANVSTKNNIWYPNADINVQISVSWQSVGKPHDASASWVEDVHPGGFRACVMQSARTTQDEPHINWFAYQGEMEDIKSHKIEVGEWHSGTHCVPVYERKHLTKPDEFKPNVCPNIALKDIGMVEQDKWQYDAHLMSQIYGGHHTEWFKRMMMGYGIKKMNLTDGMETMGVTLMMTVEQTKSTKTRGNLRDAVNVWMEYDGRSKEAYICLREMQNWDGKHEGIHVHWTLFNRSKIHNIGFSHQVEFKPRKAVGFGNQAACEYKKYLPDDMDMIPGTGATVLVSLKHRIDPDSYMDSMKMYVKHQQEVKMGMSMGEGDFDKKEVRESWTFPHMWRANLTGWRPHMRINKDNAYSAWIEGMNGTHMKVCQNSLHSENHFEGVIVDLFIMPDRCPLGYRLFLNGICGKYMPTCATVQNASNNCRQEGGFLGAPEKNRDSVWMAYLAGENSIHIALTDAAQEQQWKRGYGNPSISTYFQWGTNQPSNASADLDCAFLKEIDGDFYMETQKCNECKPYVCVKAAPWLSCNFREPNYCNSCGDCKKMAANTFSCNCIPPYSGHRCEIRRPEADQ